MNLEFVTTTFAENVKRETTTVLEMVPDLGEENQLINLYPEVRYQAFEGFGGALTDAAGYVYAQMNQQQKDTLLKTYFDENEMGYRIARIHIDSCDFSLGHYEAMSDPTDLEMKSFCLDRTEQYILPLLDDAQKFTSKNIEIMVTPWSPPAFMKTNGERNHGGKLKKEFQSFWSNYICHYIKEFRRRGYTVTRMSLQNEPKAIQLWDSCEFTAAEEKEFLKNYLYPAFVKNELTDIEIFIWDHNKERVFERACEIIDDETDAMVAGIAFHWYSGDHFEALNLVREKFPDKKLILSEACIEYSKFSQDNYLENAKKYAHDIIGNLNNGMTAFYDWNILLDKKGGPNHVGNYCDAPFLFDTEKKELLERNTLAYIRHFSRYIKPGAVRIAHSRYTQDIEVTAFSNTDDTIVAVVLNQTSHEVSAFIRLNGICAKVVIPPNSISTGIFK
ncbi:glycoside hydrolase family 30 beta sandwich domain-containing protein [Hydrogenoanaerobacterium sp.]|uniref:glycoside hydrolase family 30 protein n=1 Tax=Hydrogenoanaerobacterium sp. TaxID=2953763 RepID=UPI0028965681|nr:glycoside hydrolase family 30 beta sandwich domain-containing protein [Hydrogenoanaerobacterium sp.]